MSEQYVGKPTPAIDRAWFDLLSGAILPDLLYYTRYSLYYKGLNIDLRGSEAIGLDGRTFQWPETDIHFTGYFLAKYRLSARKLTIIRLEIFHSLHCLVSAFDAFVTDKG
jgi:hypothetical protein